METQVTRSSFATKQERPMTKRELAISCLITSEECLFHNMI